MRKTKIVCTLGPAVDDPAILREFLSSGVNAVRMNFSHGTHEEHKKRLDNFREAVHELSLNIPIILDTKGPEIRLGTFKKDKIQLNKGQQFVLTAQDIEGDETIASVSYKELYKDVVQGCRILIDDGLIEMVVNSIKGKDIILTVKNSGVISSRKGVNVPNVNINLPAITERDVSDIMFGVENDIDFIAMSFVRKASDVDIVKKLLHDNGADHIGIIAKIESRQGIENINEILRVSDAIMVARGDMGVEIPIEEVPIIQKMLIEKSFTNGKPVITATQMLDSMIRNPRPTRAEVNDIYSAITQGTSAIMLSGETAAGAYPIEAVKTMAKIAEAAEASIDYWNFLKNWNTYMPNSITNAISHATCMSAHDLQAKAIVTVTQTGTTAHMICRFRPLCPIIAVTPDKYVYRKLMLSFNVFPTLAQSVNSTDELFNVGTQKAIESGIIKDGDIVVITAGVPIGIGGTTNMLKAQVAGNVQAFGIGIGEKNATGTLCVASTPYAVIPIFKEGNILVVPHTNAQMLPIMRTAKAVVVDGEDENGYTATTCLALDIPCIVTTGNASSVLKTGMIAKVDAKSGTIKYIHENE